MTKILFVCHGNICRSPMAEFMLKDMVKKLGREDEFFIDSAATSTEELGNSVYPPVRRLFAEHGLSCEGKTARLLKRQDYDRFDLIIGMDAENMRDLFRICGRDREDKFRLFTGYIGSDRDIYDPWYTRDFQRSWDEIWACCLALLDKLLGSAVVLDLSECETRGEMYAVLRREMLWQDWYGENLDALWDILTGMPHYGTDFTLIPPEKGELASYAGLMAAVFREAAEAEEEEE